MEVKPLPVRSSTLGATKQTVIEHMSHDRTQAMSAIIPALPQPALCTIASTLALWGFLGSYVRLIAHCAIERSTVELKRLLSNTYGPEIECNAYDQTHAGLRSIATPAIERMHVTWQHISFVYKQDSHVFISFYVWEAPLGPQTICFPLYNPHKLSIIYLMFYFAFNQSLIPMGG